MNEIFDNYLENAFEKAVQVDFKIRHFEYNYKKYFPDDKDSNLLDIGIGRGEMLSCMKKWEYNNYLGIDISPSIVKFCNELGLNCELVDNTGKWLDNHPNSFSVITLLDVLEHIPKNETIDFLRSIYSSLKPGGVLIVQTPNLQSPDGQLHRYNDFSHEFGYIEHSLQQVLLTAGFKEFTFYGFEDLYRKKTKVQMAKILRNIFWKYIRFTRRLSGNLNPDILHPVFFSVAYKKN